MQLHEFVVLGAGVIGLTTAHTLLDNFPDARITIVAEHTPGSTSRTEWASPWAGAIVGFDKDYNSTSEFHRISFLKFKKLAEEFQEGGIESIPLRIFYDEKSAGEGERWFADLVGGIREVNKADLPPGFLYGIEFNTFVINPMIYLAWLQNKLLYAGVAFERRKYSHIDVLMGDYPNAAAIFNCTGLGARTLGGVEDENVFPTKGQTILLAQPLVPLQRMYIAQSSKWTGNEMSHVTPRPLGGGILVGGVRKDNDSSSGVDLGLAERIKERACLIAPELGTVSELQVISHDVGLRPSRKGGPSIEAENKNGHLIVHNYGAGGGGYEGSWGMAEKAVSLLLGEI